MSSLFSYSLSIKRLALSFIASFLVFLGALECFMPQSADGGGFHISILGVRRAGMMTNLARPDDVTALFHNPAGLADLKGTRFHLSSGVTLLGNHTKLAALDPMRFPEINPDGCGTGSNAPCPWPIGADGYYQAEFKPESYIGVVPYLGVSHNMGEHSSSLKNLTLSAALYAPGAYGADLGENKPTSYFVTKGLFVVAAATLGAGYRVNEKWSFGAAFSYTYMRLGYAQSLSTTDVMTAEGEEPDATTQLAQQIIGDMELDYTGDDHGFGWTFSTLYSPTRWLSFGFTYAGFTSARFEGDLSVSPIGSPNRGLKPIENDQFNALLDFAGIKLPHGLIVEMPIPHSLQFGVSVHPSPRFEVGLDFRLWLYSMYDRQLMEPIYDPNEPGNEPITEESLSSDKNYSESYEIALGFLYRPFLNDQLELMAGIGFDKSPVPDETFTIDNPSMDQIVLSLGIRSRLGAWQLGFAWMMINYLERDIRTSAASPPVNVIISGTSHIPTIEVSYRF